MTDNSRGDRVYVPTESLIQDLHLVESASSVSDNAHDLTVLAANDSNASCCIEAGTPVCRGKVTLPLLVATANVTGRPTTTLRDWIHPGDGDGGGADESGPGGGGFVRGVETANREYGTLFKSC